jgi:nitrate/nitrite transporter NarK
MEQDIQDLVTHKRPIVLLDSYFPDIDAPYVLVNNFEGVTKGMSHLVKKGFKRIGFVTVDLGLINSLGNLGGFVGPLMMGYLVHRTHSFSAGLSYLVGSLCLSGILMLLVGTERRRVLPDTAQ